MLRFHWFKCPKSILTKTTYQPSFSIIRFWLLYLFITVKNIAKNKKYSIQIKNSILILFLLVKTCQPILLQGFACELRISYTPLYHGVFWCIFAEKNQGANSMSPPLYKRIQPFSILFFRQHRNAPLIAYGNTQQLR